MPGTPPVGSSPKSTSATTRVLGEPTRGGRRGHVELALQASVLDLGPSEEVGAVGEAGHRAERSDGAWVDVRPRWITGADTLFEHLRDHVPWRAERRPMYNRV